MKKPPITATRSKQQGLTIFFFALLAVVLVLTCLYAGGTLRFGASATVAYVIYVVAGLLAAVLCYGVLESTGAFEGSYHEYRLKLGGAAVALVVVAAGGGLYERYGHPTVPFAMRIRFVSASGDEQKLTGTVRLFLGPDERDYNAAGNSDALFQDIESSWSGKPLRLSLGTPPYHLVEKSLLGKSIEADTIDIEVEKALTERLPRKRPLPGSGESRPVQAQLARQKPMEQTKFTAVDDQPCVLFEKAYAERKTNPGDARISYERALQTWNTGSPCKKSYIDKELAYSLMDGPGDYRGALQHFLSALADPTEDDSAVYSGLATALEKTGAAATAAAAARALARTPVNECSHYDLAHYLDTKSTTTDSGDFLAKVQELEKAERNWTAACGDEGNVHKDLGCAYMVTRNPKARAELIQAPQKDPGTQWCLAHLTDQQGTSANPNTGK